MQLRRRRQNRQQGRQQHDQRNAAAERILYQRPRERHGGEHLRRAGVQGQKYDAHNQCGDADQGQDRPIFGAQRQI